jgi:hypothetical protein
MAFATDLRQFKAMVIGVALVIALGALNAFATWAVARAPWYTRCQKVLQSVLIWLVPSFSVLALVVARSEERNATWPSTPGGGKPESDVDRGVKAAYFRGQL